MVSLSVCCGVKSCCLLLSHLSRAFFTSPIFLAIMCNYDVVHKTRNTQHTVTPPEEDWATAMGKDKQRNWCGDLTCSCGDVLADRHAVAVLVLMVGDGVWCLVQRVPGWRVRVGAAALHWTGVRRCHGRARQGQEGLRSTVQLDQQVPGQTHHVMSPAGVSGSVYLSLFTIIGRCNIN